VQRVNKGKGFEAHITKKTTSLKINGQLRMNFSSKKERDSIDSL
jgi:hypothetical protein